jgi:hypothetical protein
MQYIHVLKLVFKLKKEHLPSRSCKGEEKIDILLGWGKNQLD